MPEQKDLEVIFSEEPAVGEKNEEGIKVGVQVTIEKARTGQGQEKPVFPQNVARDKEGERVEVGLKKAKKGSPKKIPRKWIGRTIAGALGIPIGVGVSEIIKAQKKVTESGQTFEPKTATQQAEALVNDAKSIYLNDGLLDDSLGFNLLVDKNQSLTVFGNPEFIDNEAAITLTAEAGGPLWMLPVVDGKLPANIAQDLSGQLEGVSAQYLIDNTQHFRDNPSEWISFLGVHGAAPEVVGFLQHGYEIAHDATQEPWQDRMDDLRNWQPEAEPILPATPTPIGLREHHLVARVEHRDYINKADFNEAIGVVCDATGLDFASVRGSMETVAVCGGDAVEMVGSYAYVPDIHNSIAGEMEMNASAYILIPLYLLRIGHDVVKDLKGNIRSWLDKQQYRQMFDGLKERGKKFLTQKGTDNRNLS